MKSLQDHKTLKSILSEFCILDYFGKFYYEQDKVASHLITNFHGSSYELTSLTINDSSHLIEWGPNQKSQVNNKITFFKYNFVEGEII